MKVATTRSTGSKPSGGRKRRTQAERRAATMEKRLRAASELFERDGLDAVTIDQIAARAGMTKGAVYAHFESKDDLIRRVAQPPPPTETDFAWLAGPPAQ